MSGTHQRKPRIGSRKPVESNIPLIKDLFSLIDTSGLTMKQLSDTSGVHWRSIANWRKGENSVTLLTFESVAGALGYELTLKKKED